MGEKNGLLSMLGNFFKNKIVRRVRRIVLIIIAVIVAIVLVAAFWMGLVEEVYTQTSRGLRELTGKDGETLQLISVDEENRRLKINEEAFDQLTEKLDKLNVQKTEVKYGKDYEIIRDFVKAEAATMYPDLRDADAIKNNTEKEEDEIQGVIKIKRTAISNGTSGTMGSVGGNAAFAGTGNGDILEIATNCHKFVSDRGYGYGGGNVIPEDEHVDNIIDCSGYVSWVLYECGFEQFKGMQKTSAIFRQNPWGFPEVSKAEAQPGDILVYTNPNHVEILVGYNENGKPLVWTCGSPRGINAKTPTVAEKGPAGAVKILRVPMDKNAQSNSDGQTQTQNSLISLDGYTMIGDSHTVNLKDNGLLNGVDVYAVSGRKPKEWIQEFDKIKPSNPKGFIILLGSNDLYDTKSEIELAKKLKNKYPNVAINMVSVPPVGENYKVISISEFNKRREIYNNTLKSFCSSNDGYNYLDVAGCVTNSNGYLEPHDSEGIHIKGKEGNTKFLNAIKSAIANGGSAGTGIVADVSKYKLKSSDAKITFYDGSGDENGGYAGKNSTGINGGNLAAGQVACNKSWIPANTIIYIETKESGETSFANKKFFYVADIGVKENQVDVFVPSEKGLTEKNENLKVEPYGGGNGKVYIVKENATWDEFTQNYMNANGAGGTSSSSTGIVDLNASEYMTFVPRAEFEKYFEDGVSDQEKEEALKHFTLSEENELVVANWSKTYTSISNEKTGETEETETFELKQEKVNYQDIVKKYGMPLEFPLAHLLLTNNSGFAKGVANLSKDTQMTITLMDNTITTTIDQADTHTTKIVDKKKIPVNILKDGKKIESRTFDKEVNKTESYTVSTYTRNETNRIKFELSEVENWILSLKNEYEYKIDETNTPISGSSTEDPKNSKFKVEGGKDETAPGVAKDYLDSYLNNKTDKNGYTTSIGQVSVDRTETESTTTTGNTNEVIVNITKQPSEVVSREDRFLGLLKNKTGTYKNIFNKDRTENKDALYDKDGKWVSYGTEGEPKDALINGAEVLFEMLGSRKQTVDFEEYMRYLMYKLTNKDFGITEFDFGIFEPDEFNSVGGTSLGKNYYWPIGSVATTTEDVVPEGEEEEKTSTTTTTTTTTTNEGTTTGETTVTPAENTPNVEQTTNAPEESSSGEEATGEENKDSDGYNLKPETGQQADEVASGTVLFAKGTPSTVNITAKFGKLLNKVTNVRKEGIDISQAPLNYHNIIAVADGEVVEVSDSIYYRMGYPGCQDAGGYGNYVVIKHEDENQTKYAHLHAGTIIVKKGDKVKQGQVIAKMGNSGSTAIENPVDSQLYFEIRDKDGNALDPLEFINPDNPRPKPPTSALSAEGRYAMLYEFIKSHEGTTPISGDNYEVQYGYGDFAVGHGVVLKYNADKFAARGIDVNKYYRNGALIPISIVDDVEFETVVEHAHLVEKKYEKYNFEYWEIDALAARAYNCGFYSDAMKNFEPGYNKYGNNQPLYDNVLYKPITDKTGAVLGGLKTRREHEWKLFHEGIYVMGNDPGSPEVDARTVDYSGGDGLNGESANVEGDGYDKVVSFGGKTYKEYKQTRGSYSSKPYWGGTICMKGCGPTSLAIIGSGYNNDKGPLNIANYMVKETNQIKLSNTLSGYLGIPNTKLSAVESSKAKMIANLEAGRPVIVSVNGVRNNYYTRSSHIMAILGTRNGGKEVYISNPNTATRGGWQPTQTIYDVWNYLILINK